MHASNGEELRADNLVNNRAIDARKAQRDFSHVNTCSKNKLLVKIAERLESSAKYIAKANAIDMSEAKNNGMDAGKLDRLLFDEERIKKAVQGVFKICLLYTSDAADE